MLKFSCLRKPWMEAESSCSCLSPTHLNTFLSPLLSASLWCAETALQCGQSVWVGFDLSSIAAQLTCVFDSHRPELRILCKIWWHRFISESLRMTAKSSWKARVRGSEMTAGFCARSDETVMHCVLLNKAVFIKVNTVPKQKLDLAAILLQLVSVWQLKPNQKSANVATFHALMVMKMVIDGEKHFSTSNLEQKCKFFFLLHLFLFIFSDGKCEGIEPLLVWVILFNFSKHQLTAQSYSLLWGRLDALLITCDMGAFALHIER